MLKLRGLNFFLLSMPPSYFTFLTSLYVFLLCVQVPLHTDSLPALAEGVGGGGGGGPNNAITKQMPKTIHLTPFKRLTKPLKFKRVWFG